jgi:hypothetical protein
VVTYSAWQWPDSRHFSAIVMRPGELTAVGIYRLIGAAT